MSQPASDFASAPSGNPHVDILGILQGPGFGLRQPTLLVRCRLAVRQSIDWGKIDAVMAAALPELHLTEFALVDAPLLGRVGAWATGIQASTGLPVFETPRVLNRGREGFEIAGVLALPYAPGRPRVAVASLRWALRCAALLTAEALEAETSIIVSLATLREKLQAAAPQNSNSLYYLKAAHERGTPWTLVSGDVYQFGWGAKAQLMSGSFTEASGTIGTRLARDKYASAEALRRIGLPAPKHLIVTSAAEAERAAEELGYPVVVKPADKDGGVGVAAGLAAADQVRAAFIAAKAFSDRILVERHAAGQDYRLTVFKGALIWTILRRPGGVTGDGAHTISELVDIANTDPRRGERKRSPLKRLLVDDEAVELLSEQGLTSGSVPSPGFFVRLRRAANVSTGGVPFAANDKVHPDNRQLAIEVADALRLDFAGIDLLIDDIARPWHETEAVICEVNADPQLGFTTQQHLYGEIIGALCGGSGRIPIVVVIGARRAKIVADLIGAMLAGKGLRFGVAHERQAHAAGRVLTQQATNLFVATQMILAHRHVDVALVAIEDAAVLDTSLPFDRIDALLVADAPGSGDQDGLSRLLRMLAPNSSIILFDEDVPACQAAVVSTICADVRPVGDGDRGLASAACVVIEAALASDGRAGS